MLSKHLRSTKWYLENLLRQAVILAEQSDEGIRSHYTTDTVLLT